MELIILALILISAWLAFSYRSKSVELKANKSVISISIKQIAGLKGVSLHSLWTSIAMAVMQHKECTFEEAITFLKENDPHPDVDWKRVGDTYQEAKNRAAEISEEFDNNI